MAKSSITIPTGFEAMQRRAEEKRALAKLMLAKGLQSDGNMGSWVQVLAQLGNAAVGKKLSGQADKMDDETASKILEGYTTKLAQFNNDAKTSKPAEMVAKYQGDPLLVDQIKPYVEAMTTGLKEGEEHTNFGGQWRGKSGIAEGEFEPNKPTDSVLRGPGNTFVENPVRTSVALKAQGFTPVGSAPMAVGAMRDPMAGGTPGSPPASPMTPPIAPTGVNSGDGLNLDLLSPEEREIMSNELKRRAGGVGGSGGFTPPHPNIPLGNPLTAQRAPAGAVDGKPYWIINGVPYDNPEGK